MPKVGRFKCWPTLDLLEKLRQSLVKNSSSLISSLVYLRRTRFFN